MEKVPGPLLVLLEELGLAAVLRHAVAIRQDAATHLGGHDLLGVQQGAILVVPPNLGRDWLLATVV